MVGQCSEIIVSWQKNPDQKYYVTVEKFGFPKFSIFRFFKNFDFSKFSIFRFFEIFDFSKFSTFEIFWISKNLIFKKKSKKMLKIFFEIDFLHDKIIFFALYFFSGKVWLCIISF